MPGKLLENKTKLLYVFVSLICAVVLLGAGMMAMAKLSGGQMSVESEAATQSATEAVGDGSGVVDVSDAYAAELFARKVDDLHNSAAVASLLTVMDLEKITGNYAVKIAEKAGGQVLTLTTEMPVKNSGVETFNGDMEKYAFQMLALIPQLDKVEWIYSIEGSGNENQAVGEVDDTAAAEALGKAPDEYGESQRDFVKLLTQQINQ